MRFFTGWNTIPPAKAGRAIVVFAVACSLVTLAKRMPQAQLPLPGATVIKNVFEVRLPCFALFNEKTRCHFSSRVYFPSPQSWRAA
jgi:hypothetical protein